MLIEARSQRTNVTHLFLIGEPTEIFTIRVPRNKVRIPGTKFRILLVARNLPPLKPKASIDPERLVVEIPEINRVRERVGVRWPHLLKIFRDRVPVGR